MTEQPLLSVLIPSLVERISFLTELVQKLKTQSEGKRVEILVSMDNRTQNLGDKRNQLMSACKGAFLTHIDDDDTVSDDYIDTVLAEIEKAPTTDVFALSSRADLGDGLEFTVCTSLHFENEQSNISYTEDGKAFRPDITRKPWHWCVWRSSVARLGKFPNEFMGDDWNWIQQVMPHCATEVRVDKPVHFYFHRPNVSLS